MKKTKASRKLLAIIVGLVVYYFLNISLDKLALRYIPADNALTFDTILSGVGLRLPIPALFTLTKLVSAFFGGAFGAMVLRERAFVLLSVPVLIPEAPLYYVAFGEGSWLLVFKLFLTSTIPIVIFCMLGIWVASKEEH
jgi:hypothetical protein